MSVCLSEPLHLPHLCLPCSLRKLPLTRPQTTTATDRRASQCDLYNYTIPFVPLHPGGSPSADRLVGVTATSSATHSFLRGSVAQRPDRFLADGLLPSRDQRNSNFRPSPPTPCLSSTDDDLGDVDPRLATTVSTTATMFSSSLPLQPRTDNVGFEYRALWLVVH
jgi:hypothetical protein